ncbi:sulfatase-like hydrolase/transferase [Bacillus sp. EB106-08-02-XG196]|uniref:sulfatase family protein n=1 Tax=Bacillus sp. EB106-08-02-XG196 TaxID=2737049 RepID=UPI0015C46685|nr:sulfatase/phosphatase domain-containing protein [Bacillus sp. EB106-08-02-XG196]NWQ40795.1 sulfatase-like hydrolase/transferase [Bacillus sp. EB106-08-02-XG196]
MLDGVRFTNYYTSDAPCIPSRTALMTGKFGIHNGVVGHSGTADQGTCNISMIIRWPGYQQGAVDHELHYHLDLPPTIAEMLHISPPADWDGKSFAPTLKTGNGAGREYLVISQCAHVCQRSVRFGDWLYIRSYHDGFHLFNKDMLFNIKEDPHELHDLSSERPDLLREAVYLLNNWHDDMMLTSKSDVDPMRTVLKEGGPTHAKGQLKEYSE